MDREHKAYAIIFTVLGLLIVGCIAALVATHETPTAPAPPSDMKLVSGDPRRDWVVAFHDQKRAMTCYVNTQHGGIWCTEDIAIEDQLHMLAYRDAGLP